MNILKQIIGDLLSIDNRKVKLKKENKVNNFIVSSTSVKALLYAYLSDDFQKKIIVCCDEVKAKKFIEEIRSFDRLPIYFPEKDLLFSEDNIKNNIINEERMSALREISLRKNITIVTTPGALLEKISAPQNIKESIIKIKVGEECSPQNLCKQLLKIGYNRAMLVSSPGFFALRGGILDIYPITAEEPIRIDFFGDEITDIRIFDSINQRSIKKIENADIYPVDVSKDEEFNELNGSVLDYFDVDNSLIFFDEGNKCLEILEDQLEELKESISRRNKVNKTNKSQEKVAFNINEVSEKIEKYHINNLTSFDNKFKLFGTKDNYYLNTASIISYNKSLENLVKDLKKYKKDKFKIIVCCATNGRAKRLKENLQELGVNSFYKENIEEIMENGEIYITISSISNGFMAEKSKLVIIAEGDIFGAISKKRKRKKYSGEKISNFNDLNTGDYVVHEQYGIGIYRGIEKIESDGILLDYMTVEYAKGDKLYIPVANFALIQKHSAKDSVKPKLNKLGGDSWKKTKEKVRQATQEVAKDLIKLYAYRNEKKGYQYGEDTVWQKEFEDAFPYEETDGQLAAIDDVKRDMESTKIMDRLICGDVGYGKTEVAIRAAFKAVQDNKQVAYLVPTTILAKQHYDTFLKRFKEYPVNVEMLCRFKSAAEQRKTIERLKSGKVDIVIGTHRLLSNDVKYKDLGLLIIDEEQRFGVSHKEKIKKLKENVDVLTLSATPIPRTLHMSLVGVRNMSVLEEPPKDRIAIQTYVTEYDEETIREAIIREIKRGGQVYYVFNRINGILEMTRRISLLVPGARVDFAHGRMGEKELEDKMYQFINGNIDVLVSTTIIETGLDISNVNTMIIHDADHMGLSQLYQLRGRVGRSDRSAYAFLLVKKNRIVSEDAMKRLEAIREFTTLGSGFKIAMKDLEIRGAGNMLGKSQSGHMASVGYDLYCKMLGLAVKELKGETTKEDYFETTLDIKVEAYIPEYYIEDEIQKLEIYKEISTISSKEDKEDIISLLEDRYGKIPQKVKRLIEIGYLRGEAHKKGITEITERPREIRFVFYEKADVELDSILNAIKQVPNLKIIPGEIPMLIYEKKGMTKKNLLIVEKVLKELTNIA